jgi:hypothetical protein
MGGTVRCSACGQVTEEGRFCGECGAPLAVPIEAQPTETAEAEPTETAEAAPTETAAAPPKRKRRRRRVALAAFVLWSIGVAALGGAAGYAAWDRLSPHAAGPVTVERIAPALVGEQDATEVVMPDVVSLGRQAALEAVATAGLDPSTVTFEERPYAADVGSVVAQEPLGGTRDPKGVRLVLAKVAAMPKTVGSTAEAATAQLEELGAAVQTRQVYARGTAVGTVVKSTPPQGKPLVGAVTLFVSSAPAALFLSDLEAARLDCSTDTATTSGKQYDSSVVCRGGGSEPSVGTWVVDKHADGVTFAAGLTGDSDPGGTGRVVIRGDGKPLRTVDLRFGTARSVTLPLTGVTQLSIEVTGSEGTTVVLGDAKVLGAAAGISVLEARSR